MKSKHNFFDKRFRENWHNYIIQSLLGGFAIYLGLLIIELQESPIIIASVGASTFIIFVTPENYSASRRNIIGGHLVCLIIGSLIHLIPHTSYSNFAIFLYALAVTLSLFIMAITDTEHPPAAGTGLGLVIYGFSMNLFLPLALSIVVLSLFHHFFKKHLINLL